MMFINKKAKPGRVNADFFVCKYNFLLSLLKLIRFWGVEFFQAVALC